MKKTILLFYLLICSQAQAWTLEPNTARGFESNEIDIYIANTDCSGAGFSTNQYESLIKSAVKRFWNNVPTSSLYLSVKGIRSDIDISGDTHSSALAKVPNNSILAGCNDSATDFSSAGILGSAVMNCSGDTCKAVLILNAHANSGLPSLSSGDQEAVIAHEIGHAFGLGHSEYKYNLMYYSISGKFQKWLGMDDIDGVSYLYPHESELDLLGLSAIGNCGSISLDGDQSNGGNKSLFSFLIGVLSVLLLSKTRNIKNLF
ncbi:MAG: matrixin family metalloprotease [Halobacteriovoraceae bacterium]|jgi:hypothetical protein|nr:matrixin family metalloprotease [Halobacteriovoraceae bacterium]